MKRTRAVAFAVGLLLAGATEVRAEPAKSARAVFESWLEAQNTGSFSDYAALYAKGFTGVRRSRSRTVTFDRAGWLADRKRMFKREMTVEASKVRVLAKEGSALVVFTQRWSSGGYTDVGRKQLVLRRGPRAVAVKGLPVFEDFQIVREELFTSSKATPGTFDLTAFQQLAFVIDDEVVITDQPDQGWGRGPAKVETERTKDFAIQSRMSVDASKLPPEIARLVGTPIRLLNESGVRCEAKLGPLLLRGRMISSFEDEGADDVPWEGWSHFLVAKIDGDRAACAGATWARAAGLPPAQPAKAAPATSSLRTLAWEAFRRLPESRAIQRRFDAWAGRTSDRKRAAWFKDGERETEVRSIRTADGRVFVSVIASRFEGDSGCNASDEDAADATGGTLWGLWEVTGPEAHPTLVLRNQPDESLVLRLTGAADVDGDGVPEIFFEGFQDPESTNGFGQAADVPHGVLRARDGIYVDVDGPQTPVLICPC